MYTFMNYLLKNTSFTRDFLKRRKYSHYIYKAIISILNKRLCYPIFEEWLKTGLQLRIWQKE